KGDVSDWLDSGGTVDGLKKLVRAAPVKAEMLTIADDKHSSGPDTPSERKEPELRFYTPAQVAAVVSPETDWLVPGFLALGAITEIDGKIKAAGKTTLTLHMVRAVLDGEPFIGEPTRQAKVIYVTEQSRQTFGDALRLAGLGRRAEEMLVLFREDFHGTAWSDIVALCHQDGYGVVIFDTIGKLAGIREENSAGEWAVAMAPLQDLAASGRAVIVCRHDRKGGGEVGDSGRGSSQASGDVDIILALRRLEGNQPGNRRVIESLSRYRETPEKIVIELGSDGYIFVGTEEAVAAGDAKRFLSVVLGREFRQTDIGGLTTRQLEELGAKHEPPVKRWAILGALGVLQADGTIRRTGRGVAKDPYLYLPAESDSAESVETQTYSDRQTFDLREGAKPQGDAVPDASADDVDVWADALRVFGDEVEPDAVTWKGGA
ncbi:MAG: AAA family ATPase, partial [Chloroflexota bacterium]|nr:AAA family ATPase [Chloroflexota bacterium]